MDLNSKRQFLFSLWRNRDPMLSTLLNEYRHEYMNRIRYSNKNFKVFKKDGWQTDRGRVYILYGEPTYIERNPSTEGYKPYEIWQYDDIQGGIIFVLADLSGFNEYILLHSSAIGEIHYSEYMERILRGF